VNRTYWADGEQKRLAARLGVSKQCINDILHRRITVSTKRAVKLEKLTGIAAIEWLTNRVSHHVAFYGEPKRFL